MLRSDAVRVTTRAFETGPLCGPVILIAIDGRSGSGKTTLAAEVASLVRARGLRTTTVHTDELCPGWDGLPEVPSRLHNVVRQLAGNGSATYPVWDWIANAPGVPATIPLSDVVVIEGTAATDPRWRDQASVFAWIDAPAPLRKRRALARDGKIFEPHWDRWAAAEDAYFATRATNAQADIVIKAS